MRIRTTVVDDEIIEVIEQRLSLANSIFKRLQCEKKLPNHLNNFYLSYDDVERRLYLNLTVITNKNNLLEIYRLRDKFNELVEENYSM